MYFIHITSTYNAYYFLDIEALLKL